MYVIAKKKGDNFYVLSEVLFEGNHSEDMPQLNVRSQWTFVEESYLCYPYFSDCIYFEDKAEAYALLVLMDLFGDPIDLCEIYYFD